MSSLLKLALWLFAAAAAFAAGGAAAHRAVPGVRVPLPPAVMAISLTQTVGDAQRTLGETLTEARHSSAQRLIRQNGLTIEADPNGDPIVRAQIVAFDLSARALVRIAAANFNIVTQQRLAALDSSLTVLGAPRGVSTRRALQRLRQLEPDASFDYNHIYMQSGVLFTPRAARPSARPGAAAAPGALASYGVGDAARVGLIDGGVDAAHAAFRDVAFKSWGCQGDSKPTAHGTAVASLLVGSDGRFRGAAPDADLYAADVYCGVPTGGAIDSIAYAFEWLSVNQVPVINISLVGPNNAVLQQLVRAVSAHGQLIVAAVGNDGPAAAPLYPAAYPEVIGVTAVDAQRRVLLEAERGRQVHFAAPGADMVAASYPGGYAAVRGTSFAAPIVAGLLALRLRDVDIEAARRAVKALERAASDAGVRGPDTTYGYGLVGDDLRASADIMHVAAQRRAGLQKSKE